MREEAVIRLNKTELEFLFSSEPAEIPGCPPIFYISSDYRLKPLYDRMTEENEKIVTEDSEYITIDAS